MKFTLTILIALLASAMSHAESCPLVLSRLGAEIPHGTNLLGADLPLFAHQYPWLWMDPRQFKIGGVAPGLSDTVIADKIVGRYGFIDGYNPSKNWAADDSLAITVGPTYLASRNLEDGGIWKTFSEIPAIQRAREIISRESR